MEPIDRKQELVLDWGNDMLVINKDNVIDYLKKRIPDISSSEVFSIFPVGEGKKEEDGDGYVNYIFRVKSEKHAYVVKQGLEIARVSGAALCLERNKHEYDAMRIYYSIAPENVPEVFFHDPENNIFVMEDVSRLMVSRFQFSRDIQFPDFGRQCGEYIAKTEFYTSEYFLDREEYDQMQRCFSNVELRSIMENLMFLDRFNCETMDQSLGEAFEKFAEQVSYDSRYVTELYKLRRSYMSHADALIHADLHTSNILASEDEMKVIDMEFAFMGPFGYDLGYLAGNIISQYCAACFKEFDSEEERVDAKLYYLATLKSLYENYFRTFASCWSQDVKKRYIGQDGLRRSIFDEVMKDSPGYASMVNWFRAASPIEYPDFDVIKDPVAKRRAKTLSLMIDWQIMFARYSYQTVDDLIRTILFVEEQFANKAI